MHQGFEDEKGMAPGLDEAPGSLATRRLLTPPVVDRSPGLPPTYLSMSNVYGSCLEIWKLQLPDPSSRAAFVSCNDISVPAPLAFRCDVALVLSFFDRPRMQSSESAVELRRSRDTRDTRSPADQPKHLAAT